MLIRKRALNTSGYYYGDEQVLGFSHTRLNGTGATDGGHFLVVPATRAGSAQDLPQGANHALFAQRGNRLARLLRGQASGTRDAGRTHRHAARGRSSLHLQPGEHAAHPPRCDRMPWEDAGAAKAKCGCCRRPKRSKGQCGRSGLLPGDMAASRCILPPGSDQPLPPSAPGRANGFPQPEHR